MKRTVPVFIVMGITSSLMQIVALRQLLSVFSGNELDIGITLSVWLISVGTGSYCGHRIRSRHAFETLFLVIALLSQPTILLIGLIRPLFSIGPGEAIPLAKVFISTLLCLSPICLLIGLQFPLAISFSGGKAARVYGLEAAGAFLGGTVFTLLLSGRVDTPTVAAGVGLINTIAAI
ncbi:MAG: hypothetical protein HZA17_07755, partial [Nitrospirae bacterium]|nr:hypothetical protein [Nitrospirota bacterium]